jgi:hypothetical protein
MWVSVCAMDDCSRNTTSLNKKGKRKSSSKIVTDHVIVIVVQVDVEVEK